MSLRRSESSKCLKFQAHDFSPFYNTDYYLIDKIHNYSHDSNIVIYSDHIDDSWRWAKHGQCKHIVTQVTSALRSSDQIGSGLRLPLLREMVELLFADGFLPVIFATETFAVGLNMPAKSVIFTDVVKFDGQARRMLNAGEFRQMSGRAGRRGLDSEGHVYVMLHTDRIMRQPATEMLTKLYTEEPAPVKSCYRLRWSSLLHLISAGPAHVYAILTRSLLRFTERDAALWLQQEATEMVKVLQELDFIDQLGGTLPKGALACHLFVPDARRCIAGGRHRHCTPGFSNLHCTSSLCYLRCLCD